MNLSQKIAAALASANPTSGVIVADNGTHQLALHAIAASSLGVEANLLTFQSTRPPSPAYTISELKTWADRIAARITYLMEPLVVLEADTEGVTVELRSQTPTPRDGLRSYFEVRIDRHGLVKLERLAYDDSTRSRSAVPFQLSREVLERLADDLVATSLKT